MNNQSELTIVTGVFGTVTNRRVIYQREKGWFSGGSREDIPLKHVTSVRLTITRHIIGGILLLLFGVPLLSNASAAPLGFGGLLTLLAVLLLWGSPTVAVNTAGQDKNAARGWPWERAAANAFVEAIRTQLISQ